MDNTLIYYNKNAEEFVQGTLLVDFKQTQDRFLNKLNARDYILDFGCGSGRDTKYFLEKGYYVDATDGSSELCKIASDYTGVIVKQMLFEDLNEVEKYDGIWACSSILHLPKKALRDVFYKIATALKDNGILYTSFKYGDFEGERSGRYFTDTCFLVPTNRFACCCSKNRQDCKHKESTIPEWAGYALSCTEGNRQRK